MITEIKFAIINLLTYSWEERLTRFDSKNPRFLKKRTLNLVYSPQGALSLYSSQPLIQKPQKALRGGALRNQLPNMVSTPETPLPCSLP